MGVDCSIKIRLFQDNSEDYKEIEVSEQDNSLASLFHINEIKYTSIKFDRHAELTADDNKLLDLTEYEEEMMACSDLVNAKDLLKVFDTIGRKIHKLKREALNNDLNKIQAQDLDSEEKEKRKKYHISDYLHFEYSYSVLMGILKTAALLNSKVQIVVNFY